MACRSVTVNRSGHNASPGSLPNTSSSSASAGRFSVSHCSPSDSANNLPAKSSSLHLVITSTTTPPGSNLVRATARYQFHTLLLTAADCASSADFVGSSITNRFAPLPVMAPPTPAVAMPPARPSKSNRCAADESLRTDTPNRSGPCSSNRSRTFRPHDAAKSLS